MHQKAGLPEEMVCECHGSLAKNNVVLYGKELPAEFLQRAEKMAHERPDLILVLGTTLKVEPFKHLANIGPRRKPRQSVKNTCVAKDTGVFEGACDAKDGSNEKDAPHIESVTMGSNAKKCRWSYGPRREDGCTRAWLTRGLTELREENVKSLSWPSAVGTMDDMYSRSGLFSPRSIRLPRGRLLSTKNFWWCSHRGHHAPYRSQWLIDLDDLCLFSRYIISDFTE